MSLLILGVEGMAARQGPQVIMGIGMSNGASPELRVLEHETGTVSLPNVGTYGFVPAIHDDGSVTVTVLDLTDGQRKQIAEVALSTGDVVTTDTTPKFDIRILRVIRQSGQDSAAPGALMPVKFIGLLESGNKRVAIFSDSNGHPVYASQGQTVLGHYRLLKIDVASVTMSSLDGTGVQQIAIARK